MKQLKLCRLCTKLAKDTSLRKLFEKSQRKWLKIIEQITGILLKNSKSLPQHICEDCQEDLEKAHEFRERCIYAQQYFNTDEFTQQFKVATNRNTDKDHILEIKDELSPAADQSKICLVKEEREFLQIESPKAFDSCDDFNTDEYPLNDIEEITVQEDKFVPKVEIQIEKEFGECIPKSKKSKEKLRKNARKKHITGEKNQTFICDQCGNNFTSKHHFLTHLRRHTGDKRFQCEICPNKFFTHSELNRHMRRHTGEKPFACKHCGRRFTDYSTRIKHERTHTNERPFVCTQCSKGFTTSYILKNHMLVHTGERSFRCELCNKAFQRQTHLVVHYKSILHKLNADKKQQGTSRVSAKETVGGNISNTAI